MTDEKMVVDNAQKVRAQPTAHEAVMKKPPPLKHGARLKRDEFERRYDAMPHINGAELIKGVVYMPCPVRVSHGKPHALIMTWLSAFWAATPGIELMDNTTVRLDDDNEPQPDAFLRIESAQGGNSQISDDDYVEGAPELVAEIAATSAEYDLHEKLEVYQHHGVQEYIVWQTIDERLDWFRLVGGEYVPMTPDKEGVIESQVFPGLRLAVRALLEGDLARVLSELRQGLATEAYTALVQRLSEKKQ